MPSTGDDAMNEAIRSKARPPAPDLNDPAAVNRSIRELAGVPTRPAVGPPPGPDVEPADFNRWADAAQESGMDPAALAGWTHHWALAHKQHLAARRAQR
jgi:hypothetical protein